MRYIAGLLLGCIVFAAALPLWGPALGFADFQQAAHAPGETAQLDNGTLNYYQAGVGRDVVLVHGQPGSADMMAPLGHALAEHGFRVTWYDRMGWGHSGQRPEDVPANPTAHAQDLLQLAEFLAITDPLVVGYSYGGGVAMEALRLAPEFARELILISSVGDRERRGEHPSLAARITGSPWFLRWIFSLESVARAATAPVFETLQAPEVLAPAAQTSLLASLAMNQVPSHWARERAERYQDFDSYAPEQVQACSLVVHGRGDAIVLPKTAEFVHAQMAGSRLVWIDDAGHAVVMTRPGLLAGLVAEHVQACGHAALDVVEG